MAYPDWLTSKLPETSTTIFAIMSKKAKEEDALNLSQGFPDYGCSDKLVELVHHYMKEGMNQYAPFQGILPLRQKLSQKAEALYSVHYDPEKEINITSGATQALFTAITATVQPGDEVILFEPAYDCYEPAIRVNGGQPVPIELKPPHYNINWSKVEENINDNTRLIIINSPHNPTGTVLDTSQMQKLAQLVKNTNALILSDEVYEHIVFDDKEHQSVMRYPTLAERSFAVFSFGKVFHTTGWKIGYCMAPQSLMKEFRKVHQYEVFCTNHPMQHALADFLDDKEQYLKLNDLYQQKRDYFLDLIKESKFDYVPAGGTYFQSLNYNKISTEPDTKFADYLLKEAGVAAIPLSPFYHDEVYAQVPDQYKTMLRFCFAKSDETLEKAADILCNL